MLSRVPSGARAAASPHASAHSQQPVRRQLAAAAHVTSASDATAEPGAPAKPPRRLVVVDAHPILYKSFHAKGLAGLRSAQGVPTSAVYGLCSFVVGLLEGAPCAAAVVFDAPGGSDKRKGMYDDYKANRSPMPDELRAQLPLAQEIVELLGVRTLCVPGVEADDTIATLAARARAEAASDAGAGGSSSPPPTTLVQVCSSDKDFHQLLVEGEVEMLKPGVGGIIEPYTVADLRDDWQIEPEQFLDALALMGDAADNIPGIKGVGRKTAIKLLTQYGDLETAISCAGEIKGKVAREGLTHNADQARLSRQLAALDQNVDLSKVVPGGASVMDALAVDLASCDVEAAHQAMDDLQLRRLRGRWDELVGAAHVVAAQRAATGRQLGTGAEGAFGVDRLPF